jgi:parvulin-like peptidyl-prolyl isomerase
MRRGYTRPCCYWKENTLRRAFVLFILTLTAILLNACGGGKSDAQSNTDSDTKAPLVVENQGNQAGGSAQVQENQPSLAAEVNGEPITLAELEQQVALFEAGTTVEAADHEALVGTVLERLIEQKLIEQAAVEMGIVIMEEQIQAEIAALQALAAEQGITMEVYFAQQGITQEQLPNQVRATLLAEAVNAQVTANVPLTTTHVHARHILVKDEALARDIINQLNQGGDFAALAAEYSQDPSTRDAGGDLGWIAPGDLLQVEVEATVFALPANSRAPEPIQSVLGYHIIESLERDDTRPLDPAKLAEMRQRAWIDWLAQRRAEAIIVRYVGPNAS